MKGIENLVDAKINQIPKPMKITIAKVYDDQNHVDAKTLNEEIIEYIPTISNNLAVNHKGILLFLENDEMIIITK